MNLEELFEKKEKGKSKEKTSISGVLFKARNDAHITHLLQRSRLFSVHVGLEKFYDEILDLIDDFTETYMGIYPIEDICVEESCCIEEPLTYFKKLYNTIEVLRKPIKESFLQNQIDEIQKLISHTIYRLNYIKT